MQKEMMLALLSLLFFVCGCAELHKAPGVYTNDELRAYTNAYFEYKMIYKNTDKTKYAIDVEFSNLKYPTIGLCHRFTRPFPRKILIDLTYWRSHSDDERLVLIMHEMGHCDLNYGHQSLSRGIMTEAMSITNLKEEHIEQFFNGGL